MYLHDDLNDTEKVCNELEKYAFEHNVFAKFAVSSSDFFDFHMEIGRVRYSLCSNMVYATYRLIDLFQENFLADNTPLTEAAAKLSEEYGLDIRILFRYGTPYGDDDLTIENIEYFMSVDGRKPALIGNNLDKLEEDPDMKEVDLRLSDPEYNKIRTYRALKMVLEKDRYIK